MFSWPARADRPKRRRGKARAVSSFPKLRLGWLCSRRCPRMGEPLRSMYSFGDLTRLPGRHRHIGLVPQWDFLNVVADASRQEQSYELIMSAEITDLLWNGQRVSGVSYVQDGQKQRLEADLVVGCDGRSSVIAERARRRSRKFGVPMDVLWFRLPRLATDPAGLGGRLSQSSLMGAIDRGEYFQIAVVIKKGFD